MEVFLVSHTHWDREWYRTFQAFRARLVDTVDRVLDIIAADPGYRFLLDGQSIVLEDYVAVRPGRRADLERAVREDRVAIGPWYVQPDSLIPSGESHVRNLLEGRRVALTFGGVSRVAYTPDSFGHPACFPQLFDGFGLGAFVYWRGNGDEIAELPAEYRWEAPDGTAVIACHLGAGYFSASALPQDAGEAAARLRRVVDEELAARAAGERVLLMNGSDHLPADAHTAAVAGALARQTGWTVRRALLEDFVDGVDASTLPAFRGELVGGRVANLLPGVWSTRTWIKLRNRRCETALEAWAEPWAAIGRAHGAPDERPSLRLAWRELLQNQAHDSICGCSQDDVHEQMRARFDAAEELADQTTARLLDRLAGLGPQRKAPWTTAVDVAVFNPSPRRRTDVVRIPVDAYPPFASGGEKDLAIHPLVLANLRPKAFTVDGSPARLVPAEGTRRLRLVPEQRAWEIEVVVEDVPAFGYTTVRLAEAEPSPDDEDDGLEIVAGDVRVAARDDGTFDATLGGRTFARLGAIEDLGDRGDTYDFDPVAGPARVKDVVVRRRRHVSGIQELEIVRVLSVPGLGTGRDARDGEAGTVTLTMVARVAPGVARVDLEVTVDNRAQDHRLRLLFPTGAPCESFAAATTFDVARRLTASRDASAWRHPAPSTFPCQGWVHAGGLTVVAPGLVEAEVTPDGTIAFTALRAVGWLSRSDLATRPDHAGPGMPTPGAQCQGVTRAALSLLAGFDPRAARDAEIGLRSAIAGDASPAPANADLVTLTPRALLLSALKPAEEGDGIVARVTNPTDDPLEAVLVFGFPFADATAVRLDETPAGHPVIVDGPAVRFAVPARAVRTVLVR